MFDEILNNDERVKLCFICRSPIGTDVEWYMDEPVHKGCKERAIRSERYNDG